jgi:hypothetical protein
MADSFLGDMVLTDDMDPLSFPDPPCFSQDISLNSETQNTKLSGGTLNEDDCFGFGNFGDVFEKVLSMNTKVITKNLLSVWHI